jgi:DNA-binding response OmpR family regulator
VSDEWIEAGPLRLRPSTGEVWSGNRQVHLSPAESRVLELFMRSSGDGVSAGAILAAAEGGDDDDEEPVDPDVLLAQLRRKTGIRGRGPNVRKERVMLYYFGDR